MAWAADQLTSWHGIETPNLTEDEQSIAASVLWLLRGDAGQRALLAWGMGWQPAQEASGNTWIAPFLSKTLTDPYDTVRYIAHKSLLSLPGYKDFSFDYAGPRDHIKAATVRGMDTWHQQHSLDELPGNEAVPLDRKGKFDERVINRLIDERDNRNVYLNE